MQFLIKISYNLILRWNDRLPVDQSFSQFKTHLFFIYLFFLQWTAILHSDIPPNLINNQYIEQFFSLSIICFITLLYYTVLHTAMNSTNFD